YFVGTDGTHVVIYQGVPQSLGPLSLSRVQEVTDVEIAGLPPYVQSRLDDHIAGDDLGDAENIVSRLSEQGCAHQDVTESDISRSHANSATHDTAGTSKRSSNPNESGLSGPSDQPDESSQSGTSARSAASEQPIDAAAGPAGGEI